MALQALIPSVPKQSGPDQIAVQVQYYDDANPANSPAPTVFLDQTILLYPSTATANDVRAAIIARGQALRGTLAKIAQIETTFSPPLTIAIP